MTEYLDRYPTMHEYAEGKRINPKLTDLISRADAIEAVAEEWLSEASAESPYVNDDDIGAYRTLAENLFKDVPSAEADWIPCSDRLPSESGNYLITVADLRLGHNGEHTVTMADFYAEAKKWNSVVDVYAWMPLPKPYREESIE